MDAAVAAKFAEADERCSRDCQDVRNIMDDLKEKWDAIQEGYLKLLVERMMEREAEDVKRLNLVAQVFRGELEEHP